MLRWIPLTELRFDAVVKTEKRWDLLRQAMQRKNSATKAKKGENWQGFLSVHITYITGNFTRANPCVTNETTFLNRGLKKSTTTNTTINITITYTNKRAFRSQYSSNQLQGICGYNVKVTTHKDLKNMEPVFALTKILEPLQRFFTRR